MGHGLLYHRDWEQLILEDQARDYAQYLDRKHYPKAMTMLLLVLTGISLLFQLIGRIDSSVEDQGRKESSRYRGFVVPLIPEKKSPAVLLPCSIMTPVLPASFNGNEKIVTVSEKTIDIPELLPSPFKDLEEEEDNHLWMRKEMDSLEASVGIVCWEEEQWETTNRIIDFEEPLFPNITHCRIEDEEPRPINMGQLAKLIAYPEVAAEAGIEGIVIVRVLVGKAGKYSDHKFIGNAHPLLQNAVERHLHKLIFTPAIKNGKPIPFWINIPIRVCPIH